ncbi:tyrosine-type recombinase/integrase [Pantoea sp. B65]|uniref:tyrosine-type recombinase/integrase n=1 Tax=Pantoea sp. B65 TaxID=2813359 RepID=UPI0039B67B50
MPLSDRAVLHAKPSEKAYKLSDAHGLYLLINTSGSKFWYLKYRYTGKEKKLSFGPYPSVTLAEARRLKDEARAMLAAGVDPGEKRKVEKRNAVPQHTFKSVALDWLVSNRTWSEEHAERVKRYFEMYVFPRIGSRDIKKLKVPELLEPVKIVEKAGKLDVARRLQQRTAAVMRYAVQNGIIDYNPAQVLSGAVATSNTRHLPALELEQLPEFLRRIDHYKGHEQTRLALQLTLLIFIRSSELRFARWDEINLKRALWTIPDRREPLEGVKFSERGAKMRSTHLVPLSRQAVLILKRIQHLQGEGQFLVFPGVRNLNKTMSEGTINKALRVMGYDTQKDVCGHGIRTMACSALVESGKWSGEAVERQMSHQERKKVRAAYIHKARHIHEREKMMQWWADYLDANRAGWVSPYEFPWKD